MTGVVYQANSDRPTAGIARVDCMADLLHEETARNFDEIPAAEAYEYISRLCLLINALPPDRPCMQTAWVRLIAARLAKTQAHIPESELVVGLAARLVEEREAWAREKRTHYGELTA